MLLAASPILSCAVRGGGTGDPKGSGQGSPRTLVSLLLSPVYSSRSWSMKIIRTTVKVSDMHVVCLRR